MWAMTATHLLRMHTCVDNTSPRYFAVSWGRLHWER
jgi:UDP-glucuronate 4-epimerase